MTKPSGCPAASPSFCEHWKRATKPQDSTQLITTNNARDANTPQDLTVLSDWPRAHLAPYEIFSFPCKYIPIQQKGG
jgi:hypothetical protein